MVVSWDEFEGRLMTVVPFGDGVRKPTIEDLDRFEAEFGVKLPASYRDYALTIGPGEIGRNAFEITTPGFPEAPNLDLTANVRMWKDRVIERKSDEALARSYGDPMRARRLLPFGWVVEIGHGFAWDPEDVGEGGGDEYGVYFIDVDSFGEDAVAKVASNFREFVTEFALGLGYVRQYRGQEPTWAGEWATQGCKIPFTQVIPMD